MAFDYSNWINNINKESGLRDAEDAISLDGYTRKAIIPSNFNKQVCVVGDHRSNIITFECDKLIDGHDVNTCSECLIKWENSGAGTTGVYDVEDREISEANPGKIRFHWVPEADATTKAGALKFQVCFFDYNEDKTKILYRWNSIPNSELSVAAGLFNINIDGVTPDSESSFFYEGQIEVK